MKQQLIVAALGFTLSVTCTYAQDSVNLAALSCVGGKFGLVLPRDARKLQSLGKLLREEITEIEQRDGHTGTRKALYFDGLELDIVQMSNEPMRVMVTHASITKSTWNHLVPFKVGSSVNSAKALLGAVANSDVELKHSYRSDTDEVQFQSQSGVLVGVSYNCYSG